MSKTKALIIVLVLVGIILITMLLGAALVYMTTDKTVSFDETILEVNLSSSFSELPRSESLSMLFQPASTSLWEIRKALSHAAKDEKIKAVYLRIPYLAAGWAQVEEIRDEMTRFRESGKSIHAFLSMDMATEKEMFLASAANEIYMNPTSNLLLDGFMAETLFLKGTMDKLGIVPQFLQMKEYKSAETYSRRQMTPEIRSMYRQFLEDIQNHFLLTLSVERELNLDILQNYMNKGLISGDEAVVLGLVDEMSYATLVERKLRGLYMLPDNTRFISLSQYLNSYEMPSFGNTRAKIAVVGAAGTIITGKSDSFSGLLGSDNLSRTLASIREDDSIDGLILRVNSPGGSAVASDVIWQEIVSFENLNKPVIVSMSGVAGSGGYYISMGARKIICQPTSITGSIGVIFGKFNISGMMNKLGMDIDTIKVSPNSDFLSFYSNLSREQQSIIEKMMAETYTDFVAKASEGRNIPYDEFEPKAHGRIYTGNQALEAGLVDELGGFSTAVNAMRQELSLADSDKVMLEIYPKPKTIWETLSSGEYFRFARSRTEVSLKTMLEELRVTEVPAQWLLMPEIEIR